MKNKSIDYRVGDKVTPDEFEEVLRASTLGERRPVDDRQCIEDMVKHANLIVTARQAGKLVGIARTLTDFSYCAYLSDLAVDQSAQKKGIGRELIRLTKDQLGPKCTLILLSAPSATEYYPRIGFDHHPQAWILGPDQNLK